MSASANKLEPSKCDVILIAPKTQENDSQLWNSFLQGERDALNLIFEKYARQLYVYGRSMTCDEGILSDCIQDTFLQLWVKRSTLTVQVTSIKFYLIKSLRRRIVRRLSADKRRFVGRPIPDDYTREVAFHIEYELIQIQQRKEFCDQMHTSVATLSRGQQEAIYLKFYENLSYEEVAKVMNTNVKAVYNLIGKSIISLRKYFKAHPITS